MIFANLKNGCKRACNLVKNSRAVRFCVLVAVCLTFNVATALAQSGGGAGYEAGKNAISQASEQIAQYVPIATKPPSSAMPLQVSWPSSVPSPCM